VLILVYGLIVLFDLAVEGLDLDVWNNVIILVIDVLFLSVFMIEIMLRLFIFGLRYCNNLLNLVDSAAITFSFAITLVEVAGVNLGEKDSDGEEAEGSELMQKLAILLRFLRVGRLVTVMMRTMRTFEHMTDVSEHSLDLNGNAVKDDVTFCGPQPQIPIFTLRILISPKQIQIIANA